MSEKNWTVEFPDHVRVLGKRSERGQGAEELSGGDGPVIIKTTKRKALKFALTVDAKVTDPDGNVVSKPTIKLTDDRAESQAKEIAELRTQLSALTAQLTQRESVSKQQAQIDSLMSEVHELKAAVAGKANKPGPKPKG